MTMHINPMRPIVPALFFACGFLVALPAGSQSRPPASFVARLDHRELPADQQVLHALNRLSFGARPGDVQRVRTMGLHAWIEQQLHPERIDDSSMERFLSRYSVLSKNQNDMLQQYNVARRERRKEKRADDDSARAPMRRERMQMDEAALSRRAVVTQLQSARVARAVATNRQLEEVMSDFWLNHFNVFGQKGPPQPYYLIEYDRAVIRPHALGKFRDLLGSVAKSPAMLFYLDNARSMGDSSHPRLASVDRRSARQAPAEMRQRLNQLRSGGLNENYGRELLELHTVGVDGGYTQQDVVNVSRALTGWTIRPPAAGGGFIFRPEMHDSGEKIVLGRKLAAGRGIEDGEEVLDLLARHPSTANYIAKKLVRRFVSDVPPKALVEQAARVFMKTDGDIRETVRTIITSNEFFSRQAYRSKVKSPFEVVVSAMRALDAVPDSTPRTAQMIAYLGQPIYGHQAPNGYPETGESWMNAGAILNRINFGIAAAASRVPGASIDRMPGFETLRTAPRDRQVDAISAMLFGGAISTDTRAVLMTGENPLMKSVTVTQAMGETEAVSNEMMPAGRPRQGNGTRANPFGRAGAPLPQLTGIAQVIGLALGAPEFQRR